MEVLGIILVLLALFKWPWILTLLLVAFIIYNFVRAIIKVVESRIHPLGAIDASINLILALVGVVILIWACN